MAELRSTVVDAYVEADGTASLRRSSITSKSPRDGLIWLASLAGIDAPVRTG